MTKASDYETLHETHQHDKVRRYETALRCLRQVRRVRPFASAVDFGCGIGVWLCAAKALGATKVLGLEGEWIKNSAHMLAEDEMVVLDLQGAALDFKKIFDLAISIEVGEHLIPAAADAYCDSLCRSADFILFSAAIPGQGGVDHVNEQPPRYWVDKFWARDFVPLELLRPYIAGDAHILPWIRQNIMAFVAYDVLLREPELVRYALPRQHFSIKYAPL